ncbi:response regulator [Christensenellaceae bacterium OttesenSCG-928-M15]|nr:response regulator [Christensenellaceae bacterium OttesenSCG-928-M15]
MQERPKILVIDDDRMLLKMAEELLRHHYNVSLAKSGDSALQLLRSGFMPDLILLDIDMPEMDGYETIEHMRDMEQAQDVPIIFLTGLTQSDAELKGLQAGACDYITKPFVKNVLLARLEMHLETGRQKKRLRALERQKQRVGIDPVKFEALAANLNNTERQVAMLIILGYTNREICEELHYAYSYIKKVSTIIFEKAGVGKRQELRQRVTG